MATLLVKSLVIGGGVAGLTTAGIGTYYLTSKDSKKENKNKEVNTEKEISAWLIEDSKAILGDDAAGDWKTNWTNFKANQKKDTPRKAPWDLTDWNTVFEKPDAPNSFKTKCKDNLKLKIKAKTEQTYLDFLSFCTKKT